MKIKKVLSKRAYNRFKFMCTSMLGLLALTYVNDKYVNGALGDYFLSPSDDYGGVFVNAQDEDPKEDEVLPILDYKGDQTAADHVIGDVHTPAGDTKYEFGSEKYLNKVVQTRSMGYVVEFYQEQQCYSYVVVPGSQLMNDTFLGVCYLIGLGWLFIGIAIVSDIFMEAIENITS